MSSVSINSCGWAIESQARSLCPVYEERLTWTIISLTGKEHPLLVVAAKGWYRTVGAVLLSGSFDVHVLL